MDNLYGMIAMGFGSMIGTAWVIWKNPDLLTPKGSDRGKRK